MTAPAKRGFGSDFKQFFFRGLGILLPSVLTIWLLWAVFQFVTARVAEPINGGIRQAVIWVAPRVVDDGRLPEWFVVRHEQIARMQEDRARQGLRPLTEERIRKQVRESNFREWWDAHFFLRIIGLVVAIILFYLAGLLLGNFIGRRLYARLERLITRLPLIKQVYPSMKQVVDFLLGERQISFNRVVLVEYPRKGIWTVGFHTGQTMRAINTHAGGDCVSVFIPSSPTPFTGYAINLPRGEVVDLPISVEEALRFVVTGGVLVPDSQRVDAPRGAGPDPAARPRLAEERGQGKIPAPPPEPAPHTPAGAPPGKPEHGPAGHDTEPKERR
ncbi:MAG: DUF502 domain-containing protein [Phycisphaerales bacterium]|nr:MAG: DUF502 domain-containing protein [Phycisphaerales bacterium]